MTRPRVQISAEALILFATGNDNKFREAQDVLGPLKRLDIDTIEPQSLEPEEITRAKVAQIKQHTNQPFFCEDVSFFIDDINGLPGPLIKYFVQRMGADMMAQYFHASKARAVCMIGYYDGTNTHLIPGVVEGSIVQPRGESWGFNSIFEPEGSTKTFAELHEEPGVTQTHRTKALKKLKQHIEDNQ